jgi:hypothetical protein
MKTALLLLRLLLLLIVAIQPAVTNAQTVDYGKSYANLSKGVGGGTMEPGDTLQIRATFVVKSGTLDSCAFFDNIPAGTVYIPGTLAVITNEGKIYKAFTDAAGDDCGRIVGPAVTINLGYNPAAGKQATAFRRGQIKNTDKPSFFGGTCIMVASYKVKITAALGSQINLGGGSITFKSGAAALTSITFPADNVAIFTNYGLCANAVGANALGTEFNGTFGAGKNKDRGTSANVPPSYTYATFGANMPNDYYYGVSNNTSTTGAGYSIVNSWAKPDVSAPSHRVFQLWDIIGDHTGAVNPFLGNPPADTVNKNNGGYMLVINASYRIDSAFNQTITGLCPNTYYEFSLWIRNICSKCGCDSNGKGATGGAGYIPTGTGDSSGVKPNLTLAINGVDYYTTGDVQYNGLWVKKGFTYLTGPSQTTLTAMVRNNAPGGGGNDWAIDDIALANCPPNLTMLPSPNVTVCDGNQVDISSVVTSYFSNYVYWQWEKSTDNGVTWTNTGVSGVGSPTLVAGQWQYTAVYPSFLAGAAMNNTMYRLKVASSPGNLGATACAFTASTTITVLTNTCLALPGPEVNTFSGSLQNQTALLQWSTTSEKPGEWFSLERSSDGIHFTGIQDLPADGNSNGSNYQYTDPNIVSGYAWYRLRITSSEGMRYSKTIALFSKAASFDFRLIGNPVVNSVVLQGASATDRPVRLLLMNAVGTILQNKEWFIRAGANTITVDGLASLPSGTYILQMQAGQDIKQFKLIKLRQ